MTGRQDGAGPALRPESGSAMPDADYRLVFESSPVLSLILDPQLRIVGATESHLRATMSVRSEILGRNVFDVFPDNPDVPDAPGTPSLRASLDRVCRNRTADTIAVLRYEVEIPADQGGGFEERFWSIRNSPVLDPAGELRYILNEVQDITEFVQLQREGSRAEELTAELRERTEQMQAEILRRSRDLQDANQALHAAGEAKNEFLSRVSHELRTPLNAILGFSELLSLDESVPERQGWIAMVMKAGQHLLTLLDDVLDISRIEGGHLATSIEPVEVGALVTDSLNLVRPLADAAGVRLSVPPDVPVELCVGADRQRLRQVLLNLLSNAIKFNHPAGVVSVTTEHPTVGRLRINVIDTGRGIGAAEVDRLFVPFERLDAAQAGITGTGLGLALSHHLMQSMNGTLGVSSEHGRGSTFWMELPIAAPSADPPPTTDDPGARRAYRDDKRILYIEDLPENLQLVERILARRPAVTLVPATLGGVGVQLARERQPDLILLDLHLPDMPGEEVLRQLHADPETRGIPVVVLSADATRSHIDRLVAAGATRYLTKPLSLAALLHTVDDLLDGLPKSP